MQDNEEDIVKKIYRKWRSRQPKLSGPHLEEELIICFLEGKLNDQESENIKAHLAGCDICAESLAVHAKLEVDGHKAPQELIERVKEVVLQKTEAPAMEIILKVKENILEVINTTADILVGRELVPAAILRSRQIKDFKDQIIVFKDLKGIRVEVKIINKGSGIFNLHVAAKEKESQELIKDLRFALIKEGMELESYVTDTAAVIFEDVSFGNYTVEITALEDKLASILLDIGPGKADNAG